MDPEVALKVMEKITSQNNLAKQQPLKIRKISSSKIPFLNVSSSLIILSVSILSDQLLAQVTGFVDRDGIGRLGIEWYFMICSLVNLDEKMSVEIVSVVLYLMKMLSKR
jgi:hypothetical protein